MSPLVGFPLPAQIRVLVEVIADSFRGRAWSTGRPRATRLNSTWWCNCLADDIGDSVCTSDL